ncbi:permease-like cell division protein FtsX [Methylogaea oryzae]|uniref:Cell division protein FtsX n=1 Tax=Methylogaea oryzae TaxID=1295382 RepID=A0A8D4VRA9_9GAMM|nr:permease-like cell division protein FtsX [Methylogaea oryzae]BBL72396.1 cell division protein FtsX [Methylogaea oryzae]
MKHTRAEQRMSQQRRQEVSSLYASDHKSANRYFASLAQKLRGYVENHGHTCFSSLGRLWRTPVASALTVTVIAIALALPASFHVMLKNLNQLGAVLDDSSQISLFLKPKLTDEAGLQLADRLKSHAGIDSVALITKEGALREFRTYSGFAEALDALGTNPLPVVIQIKPRAGLAESDEVKALLQDLRALPEADYVQLDMEWLERLQALLSLAGHGVTMISILLSLAVLLVVSNTIRLELENRKEEIVIAKLVGATNHFIRRPFLYCGFWYGFLGSFAAWIFVTFMTLMVYPSVRRLSVLYARDFDLRFLGFFDTLELFFCASVLGIAGAWLVLAPQLRRMNPE